MKKKTAAITAVVIAISAAALIFTSLTVHTTTDEGYKLIRIHIRADSNDEDDQAVKLKVRDRLNEIITEKLRDTDSFEAAYKRLEKMLPALKEKADETLKDNGFPYKSKVRLNNEFFPTRTYEGIVVESGYYDALIVELGEGKGDNWWCVVYPPLCYVSSGEESGIKYRSLIKELWKKFIGDTFRK